MNFDAHSFAQCVGGADAVIGYGEQSQKAFAHGWRVALERVFELERIEGWQPHPEDLIEVQD